MSFTKLSTKSPVAAVNQTMFDITDLSNLYNRDEFRYIPTDQLLTRLCSNSDQILSRLNWYFLDIDQE